VRKGRVRRLLVGLIALDLLAAAWQVVPYVASGIFAERRAYVAGWLPPDFRLASISEHPTFTQTTYGPPEPAYCCLRDQLVIRALSSERLSDALHPGSDRHVRVQGRRASVRSFDPIISRSAFCEGCSAVFWTPHPGTVILVTAPGVGNGRPGLDAKTLLRVARSVRPADRATFDRLRTQTYEPAQRGLIIPGMTRRQLVTGIVAGRPWTLNVLLPPGYPLGPEELRGACSEIVFDQRSVTSAHRSGSSCERPRAERFGDVVFVLGQVETAVTQVKVYSTGSTGPVRPDGAFSQVVDTVATPSFPSRRFYVVASTAKLCRFEVAAESPRPPQGRGLTYGSLEKGPGGDPCGG
jgi:hypothetical protein